MRLYLPVFFMGGLYFVQILGAGMSGEEWEGVMFSRRPHSRHVRGDVDEMIDFDRVKTRDSTDAFFRCVRLC